MTSNVDGETSGSASNADLNSEDCLVIDVICEKLEKLPRDEPIGDEFKVRVCHVPKSLSSEKPEAFVPQCVGLGPYHHLRAELIMTEELKLGVVKRVPKLRDVLPDNRDAISQSPQNFVFVNNTIEAFYHADVRTTCDHRTLLYVLTVDGLFLLALLIFADDGSESESESDQYYFLTGKQGMPLVNAAGVVLTLDAIARDVFMLENQIPIHVLKKISGVNVNVNNIREIQEENNLGEIMLNFCGLFCPLVHSEQVSAREAEEERVHLLDLMYHLTAPQHVPESELEQPEPQLDCRTMLAYIVIISLLLSVIIGWVLVYCFMYILQLIIRWLLRPLFSKAIPWAVGPILGSNPRNMPSFEYFMSPFFGLSDSTNSSEEAVKIPSATELRKVGIKVKPAEGGISSFRFEIPEVYLPPIRLDEISEVIIRNLVAYESLTKSHEDSIFMRYIDVMSALIITSEDVQLLVDEEIIETQQSHEVVVQLFNGMMTKSIMPTKMADLEAAIKRINIEFINRQTMHWFFLEYLRFWVIIFTVLTLLPVLRDVFMEVFCLTIFRYTAVCKLRGVGDYGRNISFTSSM